MASIKDRAMPREETNFASRSWAASVFPVAARDGRRVSAEKQPPRATWSAERPVMRRVSSKAASSCSFLDTDHQELEQDLRGHSGERTASTYRGRHGMVIIPSEDNVLYGTWEAFTMFLIFGCAFFIPFDLLVCPEDDEGGKPAIVVWINVLMDCVFLVDILVNFFVAYPKQAALETDTWEVDKCLIARRYCGWPHREKRGTEGMFWIDIVATAPSWLQRLSLVSRGEASKLLRAIRLTRVVRFANVGVRLEEVMSMNGLNLHILEVLKTLVWCFLTFHWMACVWVACQEDVDAPSEDECLTLDPSVCHYALAVYWAVVTMTGTGYGDKVAGDVFSYITCSALMFLSAFLWAWVTGVMISVITELTRNSDRLKGEIADLEDFCDDRCMTAAIRKEAKLYLLWSKDGPKHGFLDKFMHARLSPRLIWEVKSSLRGNVFDGVWWAKRITGSARAELCNLMTRRFFGKNESFLPQRTLVFIKQGSARVNLRTLRTGDVWGSEQILYTQNECLYSRTLENLDCLLLSQESLKAVCDQTSWVGALVRREQVKLLVLRGLHRIASEIRKRQAIAKNAKKLGPRHVHVNREVCTPSFSGGLDVFRYDRLRQELTELSLEMLVITRKTYEMHELSRRQTKLAHQLRAQLEEMGVAAEAEPPGGPWGPASRC